MELVQLKFQQISELLEGPKSLQEWREKPQKGVQYRLLFLFLLITLITISVFQALFVGIFKLRHSFGDDPPPTSVELVYTYTLFSFLIGSIIGNILFGITADRIGRRKTLLISLLISIPYAFVYTMVLWIVSAMNFSTWSGLIMVSFALILGILNNQIPIVLASSFDISSFLAQATTVVLILLIGGTFAPAVVKELISFGILFATDHEWFFPIYGIILSVILIIPFALTYFYIPETLGKEVPPHPLEAMYTSVFTEESEKDSLSAPISNDPVQLLPPISDVDHGWLYPLFVLRDVRTWILFWITFTFYGAFTATNYLSLIAITEYDDSLTTPLKSFGVVFIVERVVVSVIGLGIIFAISAQFPQYIMQVGYLLLLRISLSVILFVTLFCVFFTLVLSFAVETWLYWVALAVYPTLLDVSFVASLFYLISIICLASNVGFRNESGFLFAFISAALLGGVLVFVTTYFALSTWLEFMNFYRYPLIFFLISISIGVSTALAFTKLDSELNEPRSELRKEKNEKLDRLIYMLSPLIYFLFIGGVTVFFFITSLF